MDISSPRDILPRPCPWEGLCWSPCAPLSGLFAAADGCWVRTRANDSHHCAALVCAFGLDAVRGDASAQAHPGEPGPVHPGGLAPRERTAQAKSVYGTITHVPPPVAIDGLRARYSTPPAPPLDAVPAWVRPD